MSIQKLDEVVVMLREREHYYTALAQRYMRLAEDATFFGDDDFYDYLSAAEAYSHMARQWNRVVTDIMATARNHAAQWFVEVTNDDPQ